MRWGGAGGGGCAVGFGRSWRASSAVPPAGVRGHQLWPRAGKIEMPAKVNLKKRMHLPSNCPPIIPLNPGDVPFLEICRGFIPSFVCAFPDALSRRYKCKQLSRSRAHDTPLRTQCSTRPTHFPAQRCGGGRPPDPLAPVRCGAGGTLYSCLLAPAAPWL